MFTGLIETVGHVNSLTAVPSGFCARIRTSLASELSLGESVAVNGVCLTVTMVDGDEMQADIGPETAKLYAERLQTAGTIVWNGPLGVFENPEFAAGTRRVAEAIAASSAFSIAGGGDTLAAIEQFHVGDRISYISTGGGAFLEFLEGKQLPAVATLEQRAARG